MISVGVYVDFDIACEKRVVIVLLLIVLLSVLLNFIWPCNLVPQVWWY